MISTLIAIIKEIIENQLEIIYLRATPSEANYALEKISLQTAIAIHIDQTTASVSPAPNSIITVPVQIFFVFKELSQDTTLEQTDSIVAEAEKLAYQFYDILSFNPIVSPVQPMEEMTLERLEAYRLFDTLVSGVLMNIDVPVPRSVYYCPPVVNPL